MRESGRVDRILRQEHDMNQIIVSHLFDHISMRYSKEQVSKRTNRIYLSVEYILDAMFCLAECFFSSRFGRKVLKGMENGREIQSKANRKRQK